MKTRPSYFSDCLIAMVVILCTVVLLGALLVLPCAFAPWETAASLRISAE